MENRGLTLVELIVVMVISGIIFLAVTCQFVAEQTFRTTINDQIAATNDASIAMSHMTRVLRHARHSTVSINAIPVRYIASIRATIDQDIAGTNLPEFTADTQVIYGRKQDNTFEYTVGANVAQVISRNIIAFSATFDRTYKILTVSLTAQRGNKRSSINSKIRVLGI